MPSFQVVGTIWGTSSADPQTNNASELRAVLECMAKIPPAARPRIWTDSKYVLLGYGRGREDLGQTNVELWNLFWQRVGDKRPILRKVDSHQGAEQIVSGALPLEAFWGNALAGSLASAAAKTHQVPDMVAELVGMIDERATLIQKRLLAAGALAVEAAEAEKQKMELQERAPRDSDHLQTILRLGREAGHDFHGWGEGHLRCENCLQKMVVKGKVPGWAKKPCPGKIPAAVHADHRHHLRTCRGILYCGSCGKWTLKHVRGLRGPCQQTKAGHDNLQRLGRGARPFGLAAWPRVAECFKHWNVEGRCQE